MSMKKKMLQEGHRLYRCRNMTAKKSAVAVIVCQPELSCVVPEGRFKYCDDDAHTPQSLNPLLRSSTSRSTVDALGVDRRDEEVTTESGTLKLAKSWLSRA
jgi:hypothetical protein